MSHLRFQAVPTLDVAALRAGGPDAYGHPAERTVSDGGGNPCRHCLTEIPIGEPMIIVAWCPFSHAQPYAETGPIFLCGKACARSGDSGSVPAMFLSWPALLARGYGTDERIVYGSGAVVPVAELVPGLHTLFDDPAIDFVHLRSASYNCFQCRVERGTGTGRSS